MKPKALWDLMRLDHGVMIFVAIVIGSLVAGGGALPNGFKLVFCFLTGLFLEASTFALNDYVDLDIDTKNKRNDRPLVRGDILPRTALIIFYALFPLGIVCSLLVNVQCFGIALLTGLLALVYDLRLKKVKLLGNVYIAYVMAVPFLFGASAVSTAVSPVVLVLSSIAFFAGLGREIMKDVIDMTGDKSQNVRSLPLYIGESNSHRVTAALYVLAVGLSLVPFLILRNTVYYGSDVYLALIGATDVLFLVMAGTLLARSRPPIVLFRKVTLVAMVLALIGFLAAALLRA